MQQCKVQPNSHTNSADISACEDDQQQWTQALMLSAEMQRREVQTTVVTCIATISACEIGQQWAEALKLFSDIQ